MSPRHPHPIGAQRHAEPDAPVSRPDAEARVDRRLRRTAAAFYLVAGAVGLLVTNSPLGQGYQRAALNLLAPVALLSVAAIWFLPWERYRRNLFAVANLSSLALNALLVAWGGGWASPFVGCSFFATVFAALYYRRRLAGLIGLAATGVAAAPLLTGTPPPEGWGGLLRLLLAVGTTHLAIVFVAGALKDELARLYSESGARREFEARLAYQAFHDPLTGLPNRAWFAARLEDALARAPLTRSTVAVLFLDLDRFKVVNDSLGHERGDQLLAEVAERLRTCPGVGQGLARLGGDEFTVLLTGATEADACRTAGHILAALEPPIHLAGRELVVTASIGIALGGESANAAADLLRDADMAMYRVKHHGRSGIALFDAGMNATAVARLEREMDLRHAIANGEFVLVYQPKVDLQTGRIVGMEALVRWQHPREGLLPPSEFIALAEETGLMLTLGQWVLTEACRQTRAWLERWPGRPPLTLSVNLAAQQFRDPGLGAMVVGVLDETGLPATALQLEITESTVMDDVDAAVATLRELRAHGLRLALDDFGTGYSSLSYLKRFPLDVLKIDKSFVDGLGRDTEDTAIVAAVIALAHILGMQVIAEGVETLEQAHQLRQLSCELGQGYLFGRPLAPEALESWLDLGQVAVPLAR
jgi:diguanylate cyclase (GGDEF)-like protein